MKIAPIMANNFSNSAKKQNFKGITREISYKEVDRGFCGDGYYTIFNQTLEYRPFKDETNEEIEQAVKKLGGIHYNTISGNGVWHDYHTIVEVVVGETLDCTKETADYIIKNSAPKKPQH